MIGSTGTDTTAFDKIVAQWGEAPRCDRQTKKHQRCKRPANWSVNLHGCSAALLCSHHWAAYCRVYRNATTCSYCDRTFSSFEAAITAVRL